jgi:hypothetical protein
VTRGYRSPIEDDVFEVELGYYEGPLERLLAGLQEAGLEGATLEVDGSSEELARFIEERTRDRPDLIEANTRTGRRFLGGRIVIGGNRGDRLPIEGDTFAVLRDMLERHADIEIAGELTVLDAEGSLVHAPDAGYNEIWVAERLPQRAVDAIRAALGDGLRPPEPLP